MRLSARVERIRHQASNEPAECLNQLEGSLVAMVTPFRNEHVDGCNFSVLCDRQVRRGSSGLVACGSTGEAASLSVSEHGRVVAMAAEAAAGRVPVIAGCGAPATEAAMHLAVASARNGASALLCAAPPYTRPTQAGIEAHVRAVAHAADLPLVLYDVPGRTGVAITDDTIARLFEDGLIMAIKDAGGDLSRPARLRARCGEALVQYSGDDTTSAAHRAMGGHGCISVTANLVPALCASMHRAWRGCDFKEFGRVRDFLSPLHDALFEESNPIPIKAALEMAGLCEGELRLPLTRAREATIKRLNALLPTVLQAEDQAAGITRFSLAK